ncbi:hypothetical protein [Nakamurella leprariae]|uniref:Uncharacterized protein n=1 Tax=Nakamurella leprariae TaxID=2803911 RepID=A0A938YF27_9ACTN|nr:hypothetical protein [Nakamurella leprariae]MBM9467242.1 hypothetical protein [Nakamurella leprariae]
MTVHRWGSWIRLNNENVGIPVPEAGYTYSVPVHELLDAAGAAFWLSHLSEKGWVTTADLSALRTVIADLRDEATEASV